MSGLAKTPPPSALDLLRAILSTGTVRVGESHDAVDGIVPALVAEPANEAEVSKILACANSMRLQVAPKGHGTKAAWGVPPQSVDLVISTSRMNRVLEHAHHDMTATVEAGTTIAELQRTLALQGQRLALDPLWPEEATVGGVIATNDSGALRLRYGSVRDLIIGVTVVLPDGTIAKSGGKVVKNVAGYDLPKLMSGSFGTLGIITRAVFRLHPLPEQSRTLTFAFANCKMANEFMLAIADSTLVPTGLQLRTGPERKVEVDLRCEGIEQGIAAQLQMARKLGSDGQCREQDHQVWNARQELWRKSDVSMVYKLSMLPTELSSAAEFVKQALSGSDWTIVMQSTGLGLLRAPVARVARAMDFLSALRTHLAEKGGSVVVLQCAPELKLHLSVWGEPGSAFRLMKRMKEQFDPLGILNRGRFVGGI